MFVLQDQSKEDKTRSQSSSASTQPVLQSPNSSVHVVNRKDAKENTQHPEHTSGDRWVDLTGFTWSTEQTPDQPEDLSLSHRKDRTWTSAPANMEETIEEDIIEVGTVVTRELTISGDTHKDEPREDEKFDQNLGDEEEEDWKDTHMESEERRQNSDTSRYVALPV